MQTYYLMWKHKEDSNTITQENQLNQPFQDKNLGRI